MRRFDDVDGYIAAAPKAEESISYGMPYYKCHGALVGFAAYKQHVSLFGAVREQDRARLRGYDIAKGTIRFPIGRPLPVRLIRDLVAARARRNDARAARAGSCRRSQRRVAAAAGSRGWGACRPGI